MENMRVKESKGIFSPDFKVGHQLRCLLWFKHFLKVTVEGFWQCGENMFTCYNIKMVDMVDMMDMVDMVGLVKYSSHSRLNRLNRLN